ncbi:hypothetical protein [Lichenifustis flavocetrariae]|uniref:General stress protein n=1 Tax=Lichenifustis flavocetrariae TaxID=2949735 RepID=A0AA41Z2G8_9HYPH|nr:hypothetical protein [Lichenifustis flavocetrariae]MCW6511771.1 general stress protein [Lichenifustis flavocetrariae]
MMAETKPDEGTEGYAAREVVGVFDTPEALEAAVDRLQISGFDRAAISVLASDKIVKERLGRLYDSVAEIVDDPRAPLAAFVSQDSRMEGKAAAVGAPLFIGGIAGGLAVVASGGALAAAIVAAMAAGAVGAGIGGLLARLMSHHHIDRVEQQLAQGGLVLWVSVRDDAAGANALEILIHGGARDAHLHEIQREWHLKDWSSTLGGPDPFLESDPATPLRGTSLPNGRIERFGTRLAVEWQTAAVSLTADIDSEGH